LQALCHAENCGLNYFSASNRVEGFEMHPIQALLRCIKKTQRQTSAEFA